MSYAAWLPKPAPADWDLHANRMLALAAKREIERRAQLRQITKLFPDDGPLARHLYHKSLEFFRAGKTHLRRLFLGGNRSSKTISGCFEDVLHLTGDYDGLAPWWEGHRFDHPIKAWICGTADEKIKETLQEVLLGPPNAWGTGLIPGRCLVGQPERAASPIRDLVDTVRVQHVSGGVSTLQFKSYKQGRAAFEGTFIDLIHNDEEVPGDIHTEQMLRTMDTTGTGQHHGRMLLTFTPLQGLSETVLAYMPEGEVPTGPQPGDSYVVMVGWDDVPHLDEATKASMLAAIPPFQRDARSRGIPVLGAGVIFPVPEDAYLVDPFAIPKHWIRAYGMDVGWNWTAAVFGAYDREQDTWYLYHEYLRGEAEPSIHVRGVQAPGAWIPGCIDPAANGRSQVDGRRLLHDYQALGLHLTPADNAVESGLYAMWDRMSTGRLKILSSLSSLRKEIRLYHRDERGRVVKTNDHLCDAWRYLLSTGASVAKAVPVERPAEPATGLWADEGRGTKYGWMG